MPTRRTLIVPTDGADPSVLLANLFSTAAGMPPTLVDGDGEALAFVIADPSDSVERAYDARPIPDGTTAVLALGNELTGVIYAETNVFAPLPVAAARVTTIQAGSSTQPAIVSITLDPTPYGGTWAVDGLTLRWNASQTDFAALFPGFAIQKTGTYTWQMTGLSNGAYLPAVSVANLRVPTGLAFDALDLSARQLAADLLAAGSEQLTAQMVLRITFPGAGAQTFYLSAITVDGSILSLAYALPPAGTLVTLDGAVLTTLTNAPLLYEEAA